MLLNAFAKIKNIQDLGWKLRIVGPIEVGFQEYIDKFFKEYPNIKELVEFTGEISNREELFKEYEKSKIFSLTSKFESFGIAFIEAAALGNVIVSTDVGIAKEIVADGNGAVVNIDDTEELSVQLEKFMTSNHMEEYSLKTCELCKENFDWNKIIKYLNDNLNRISQ